MLLRSRIRAATHHCRATVTWLRSNNQPHSPSWRFLIIWNNVEISHLTSPNAMFHHHHHGWSLSNKGPDSAVRSVQRSAKAGGSSSVSAQTRGCLPSLSTRCQQNRGPHFWHRYWWIHIMSNYKLSIESYSKQYNSLSISSQIVCKDIHWQVVLS